MRNDNINPTYTNNTEAYLIKKRDIELSIEELRSTNIERHIGDTDILPYKFHRHKEPAIGGCDYE